MSIRTLMARRPEGLQKRGSVWWLRVRVPDQLRPVLRRGEFRKSLGTSDPVEARRRLRIERLRVDAEFDDARRLLKAQEPSPLIHLTDSEIWHLAARWFVREEKRTERSYPLPDRSLVPYREEELEHLSRSEEASPRVHAAVEELLRFAKIDNVSGDARRTLWRYVHAAMIEAEKRLIHRLASGAVTMPLDHRFRDLSAATQMILQPGAPKPHATLTILIERYDRDPGRPLGSPKTQLKRKAQLRLFREVLGGDTPLSDIDRDACRRLVDMLAVLPANMTKRYPKRSAEQVAQLAKAQGIAPMSSVTANSYLTAFHGLMQFAVDEHLVERNPADGLKIAADQRVQQSSRRLPFSVGQLNVIFRAPLYVGCKDDEGGYALPGPHQPRRGRFWLPLVALFSGMRLNEIAQLTEDDVVIRDEVPVILIRSTIDGTKRVKTAAGHRFVPVHPELQTMGFQAFVETMRRREKGGRLFPELSIASTGYASDNFSKWFARFLDSRGIKDVRLNFHSFRHGFRDALREASIPQDRVRELGGWSSRSTEDGYGKGTKASTLAAEIAKIEFVGLDLDHIRQGPQSVRA